MPQLTGIAKALSDFAYDPDTGEGVHSALAKAEEWRDTLEEMMEMCNKEQLEACRRLLNPVRMAIRFFAQDLQKTKS